MTIYTVHVPARCRKWRTHALLRDYDGTLYRVGAGPARMYHEDCPLVQSVHPVPNPPADWQACKRLLAIMRQVKETGMHVPGSRCAHDLPPERVAAPPAHDGMRAHWEAVDDAASLASWPWMEICADTVYCVWPRYDETPVEAWLTDPALAEEARGLCAQSPSMTQYPKVSVHRFDGRGGGKA